MAAPPTEPERRKAADRQVAADILLARAESELRELPSNPTAFTIAADIRSYFRTNCTKTCNARENRHP